MLFFHVLLFFTLGTFTIAAPVSSTTSSLGGCLKKMFKTPSCMHRAKSKKDVTEEFFDKWKVGYWSTEYVSEYCPFSRPVCTMNLIYLDRPRRKRVTL